MLLLVSKLLLRAVINVRADEVGVLRTVPVQLELIVVEYLLGVRDLAVEVDVGDCHATRGVRESSNLDVTPWRPMQTTRGRRSRLAGWPNWLHRLRRGIAARSENPPEWGFD